MLSLQLAVGLMLAWVGERVVEAPSARWACTGLGVALMVLATGLRLARAAKGGHAARVHRLLAALHGLALLALGLYAWQSDLFTKAMGHSLESSAPVLAGVLAALWPAVLLCALTPTVLVELSFAELARAPRLEDGRITEALFAGLGLAFAAIFAVSVQYVATERDAKVDFSYFRVGRPGEAMTKLMASLDEPLEVVAFFPPGNDVAEQVMGYFAELKAASPQLKVSRLDYALDPVKAKDLGVSDNGTVVFKKGSRKEKLYIGTELEKARTGLRLLDADVQKRVLQVARPRRTVYLTAGHGERTQDPLSQDDRRGTVAALWKLLQDQNHDVRPLTGAEGLGAEVPKDAAAVFIVGPQRPFTDAEARALEAYEARGGRLFIALDPDGQTFDELLGPLALTVTGVPIAQERAIANVRPPPSPADRVNVLTRSYSAHPAVTNLSRAASPVLFLNAGGLDERPTHPADLAVDFAIRSQPDAWADTNRNFQFDEAAKEQRKAWGLMAAVSRRAPTNKPEEELRALVLSDSDFLSDEVLPLLPGNQYLVLDGVKWLLGEEQLAGTTNAEVDQPLSRSRAQDSAWFYGTTFLAPLAVVGVGFAARRRTKKAPAKKEGV